MSVFERQDENRRRLLKDGQKLVGDKLKVKSYGGMTEEKRREREAELRRHKWWLRERARWRNGNSK